ncbi:MAG: carboxypeptidase regulatory-like domain-containing protein [Planctomycetaceae bacterium]|nr:carboxypeptidase regulatory-like domain-containing protein [Planctomycetaceae bacterium]
MTCNVRLSTKLIMVALAACCFGCSGSGTDVDLGTVSGVVTMDGQPLANAIVIFAPENGNPSSGKTDSKGFYELVYLGNNKGAIIGQHKVRISTAKPSDDKTANDTGEADLANADLTDTANIATPPPEDSDSTQQRPKVKPGKTEKDPIPEKYNTKTTLTAEVKSGSNTLDFKLDSK